MYTTYDALLMPWLVTALESLKQEAQQDDAPVAFPDLVFFGEPLVIHASGGVRGYRFHLSNSRVHLFIGGAGKNQPALWVQPVAEFIHEAGPVELVKRQRRDVAQFFTEEPTERVNRLDLHVDLAGLSWDVFDWRISDGRVEIRNATCRAKDVQTHTRHAKLTGLSVGRRTGNTYLRIFDKTAELAKSGHLAALAEGERTHYQPEIWSKHGWKGQTGVDKKGNPVFETVIRFEWELPREVLKQFRHMVPEGEFIDTWDTALRLMDSIWFYCVHEWFVMREPGTAGQKTRWPRAAWWDKLVDLKMLEAPQVIGARVLQKQASMRKLGQLVAGVVTSVGTLSGACARKKRFKWLSPW